MVLHNNLNTKQNPCTSTPGYNYARCINKKIASTVGCQTFWTDLPGIPFCSSIEQYGWFNDEYDKYVNMEKKELLSWSGCLRPCKYMEYVVRKLYISFNT